MILSGQNQCLRYRQLVHPRNSWVNSRTRYTVWPFSLDLSRAWIDPGPSPAGNRGPYLQVPGEDESVHRVYPRKEGLIPVQEEGIWYWVSP